MGENILLSRQNISFRPVGRNILFRQRLNIPFRPVGREYSFSSRLNLSSQWERVMILFVQAKVFFFLSNGKEEIFSSKGTFFYFVQCEIDYFFVRAKLSFRPVGDGIYFSSSETVPFSSGGREGIFLFVVFCVGVSIDFPGEVLSMWILFLPSSGGREGGGGVGVASRPPLLLPPPTGRNQFYHVTY